MHVLMQNPYTHCLIHNVSLFSLVPPTGFSPTATTAPGQVAGPMAAAQRKVDPDQMPSPVSIDY